MKRPNFPMIQGFEWYPQGRLLAQVVDFDRPVGIAYERCIGYTKPRHTHDRFTITFPRGASRSEMEVFPEAETFRLDSEWVHLMPTLQWHEQRTSSAVYDTFALFVTDPVLDAALESLGIAAGERAEWTRTSRKVKRSRLLDELVDRYFLARVMTSGADTELEALERYLVEEVFRCALAGKCRPCSLPETISRAAGTAVSRSLEYVEMHLFEAFETRDLVAYARASQATLFRQFRKEIGMTPFEYVRQRRLDEAATLLRSGNYQVGDVALLVGYEDLSAFSKAFKRRFEKAPSTFLPPE